MTRERRARLASVGHGSVERRKASRISSIQHGKDRRGSPTQPPARCSNSLHVPSFPPIRPSSSVFSQTAQRYLRSPHLCLFFLLYWHHLPQCQGFSLYHPGTPCILVLSESVDCTATQAQATGDLARQAPWWIRAQLARESFVARFQNILYVCVLTTPRTPTRTHTTCFPDHFAQHSPLPRGTTTMTPCGPTQGRK